MFVEVTTQHLFVKVTSIIRNSLALFIRNTEIDHSDSETLCDWSYHHVSNLISARKA